MHFLTLAVRALAAVSVVAARSPGNIYDRMDSLLVEALKAQAQQPVDYHPIQERSPPKRFLTRKTRPFAVDGKSLPDVDFNLGESYAGLQPISSDPNETRKLFFWFFPSINPEAPKKVVTWLQGGPGCSSLGGLLQANGPFNCKPGTYKPVRNSYDLRNLTNMLLVEQPVGVGFTQGTSNITNEEELAQQFVGFYEQFVKTLDIYLSGESYAGYYIPYIADEFINVKSSDMPLKGIAINDPYIGDETLGIDTAIQPFVAYWANLLGLRDSVHKSIEGRDQICRYAEYREEYFKFPPLQKPFPAPEYTAQERFVNCDASNPAWNAISKVNPCFTPYHASDGCPTPWSVVVPFG